MSRRALYWLTGIALALLVGGYLTFDQVLALVSAVAG